MAKKTAAALASLEAPATLEAPAYDPSTFPAHVADFGRAVVHILTTSPFALASSTARELGATLKNLEHHAEQWAKQAERFAGREIRALEGKPEAKVDATADTADAAASTSNATAETAGAHGAAENATAAIANAAAETANGEAANATAAAAIGDQVQ